MARYFIYIIFIMAFFSGSIFGYGFLPTEFSLLTEATIYLLFLYSLIYSSIEVKKYHYDLSLIFIFFILTAICSVIINNYYSVRPIQSLRLIMRFYLFYLSIINLNFDNKELKKINKLIYLIFLIQIPTVIIKYFFYGVGESTIGTYDLHGGTLSTVIPITSLGYLAGYYYYYKPRPIYLLLCGCFILFGILGAKAALFILLPMTFIGIYYLIYFREKKEFFAKKLVVLIIFILFSGATSALIIKYNVRLNKERQVGGSIDFGHTIKYAKDYTTAKNSENRDFAAGRISTIILSMKTLSESKFSNIFFGFGPGSLGKSIFSFREEDRLYQIAGSYGKTGFSVILIEYGILGVIFIIIVLINFLINSWKWYNSESDEYWKAFSFGTLIFTSLYLFVFFFYSQVPLLGDTTPPIYYYAAAITYLKRNEFISQENEFKTNVAVKR